MIGVACIAEQPSEWRCHRRSNSASGMPVPDTARIKELAVRCVVAEKQRPDAMSAALRVTPSDHDEFFPIDALDFEPGAPIGLIPAIDALRYDALNAVFARQPMKGRALPDLVIVVSQAIRRTVQQRCQASLAVHERQSQQVLAVLNGGRQTPTLSDTREGVAPLRPRAAALEVAISPAAQCR